MHEEISPETPDSQATPPPGSWRPGAVATFAIVIAAFLVWWLTLALRYPYFYLADMDLLAPLEALNLNSGYEAWVPLHPGYGMYLLDALSLRLASALGLVSIHDLHTLEGSLSPLLTMAEISGFFRLHSPILVFGIALSLWAVATRLGRFPAWLSLLLLLAIGTSEGLAYQAAVIRVELYSAFFWSISLPIAAMAASQKRESATAGLLTLCGVFLGLAFLTKIQSGVHLMAAGLIFWTSRELNAGPSRSDLPSRKFARVTVALSLVNLIILAALLIASRYTTSQHFTLLGNLPDPGNYAGAPIARAVAAVCGCGLLLALQLLPAGKSKWSDSMAVSAQVATWVVAGGLLAILSPLGLYREPSTGITFALHNLQTLFWTNLFLFRSSEPTGDILATVLRYRWWVVAAMLAAWLTALAAISLGRNRSIARAFLATAWAAFAVIVLVAAVRRAPRDMIWFDTGLTLAAAALIAIALDSTTRTTLRRGVVAASGVVLAFLTVTNFPRLVEFPGRMDTNYHIYGWTESPWMDCWFASPRYNKIMADRYRTEISKTQAARQARNHWRLRVMLGHVFQNADITLTNAGPVAIGEPVWTSHREWTFAEIPRGFNGAHIIDPLNAHVARRTFLSHVLKHEEWLDRETLPPANAGGQTPQDPIHALSILTRRDIDVMIFAPEADIARLSATDESIKRRGTGEEAIAITVSNGTQSQRLIGAALQQYTVLPLQDFTGPFFFVIRERNLPPSYGINLPNPGTGPAPAPNPQEAAPTIGDPARPAP